MTYIILTILGIVAALIVKSEWRQEKRIFFILVMLIVGLTLFLGIVFTLEYMGIIKKSGSSFFTQIPWREIGIYFSMIVGMIAKYFYDAIISSEQKKKVTLRKRYFFLPVLVSPIVFGTMYSSLEENTSTILLLVSAFQNGFFWQTVLNKPEK